MAEHPNKTVLVVDDEPDVRNSLATLLRCMGWRAETAPDGRAALDYLRTHPPPCLIVLDLRMPRMDGWEFLEYQRRSPDLARVPVVVSSAELDPGPRAKLPPVTALWPKPGDPVELCHLLESHCRCGGRALP